MKHALILIMASAFAPALATAQDTASPTQALKAQLLKTQSKKTVECYCTDKAGQRVEMGETICLKVDGKSFMAQCQMSLNNPMWRKVSDGCISS